MDQNKDCAVNYAGVCLHQVQVDQEVNKRAIIVAEMSIELSEKETQIQLKNATISNNESLISRLREYLRHTTESCYKEIKRVTDDNISLDLENKKLRENIIYLKEKYRNTKHRYFYGFVFGFVICQIINIFLNGSV